MQIIFRGMIHEATRILQMSKAQNGNKKEKIGIFKGHLKISLKIEILCVQYNLIKVYF